MNKEHTIIDALHIDLIKTINKSVKDYGGVHPGEILAALELAKMTISRHSLWEGQDGKPKGAAEEIT